MTKKGQYWFDRFISNFCRDIHQAYLKPSQIKVDIFNRFSARYKYATVLYNNCFSFTVAGLTDDMSMFVVHTRSEHYEFVIDENNMEALCGKLRSSIR